MIERNIALCLGEGFTPERVRVSQFDTIWRFVFDILYKGQKWEIPSGASAVLNGHKPDGNVFAFGGTIANNRVSVDCDVQMTAVAGVTTCELSILSDGKVVGTANFVLDVEAAPKSPDDVSSESTLPAYESVLDQMATVGVIKFPSVIKSALLSCFQKVAWTDAHGQDYYNNLFAALYGGEAVSITAVFTQGQNTIYTHDNLDTLKQYLVVTAHLESDTDITLADDDYNLSGTLNAGTSTIIATYEEKTANFTVEVTQGIPSGYTKYDWARNTVVGGAATSNNGICVDTGLNGSTYSTIDCTHDILFKTETVTIATTSSVYGARAGTGTANIPNSRVLFIANRAALGNVPAMGYQYNGVDGVWLEIAENTKYNFITENKNVYLNGTAIAEGVQGETYTPTNITIALFGEHRDDFYAVKEYVKIYHFIVRDSNGNTIAALFPCKNSSNVAGFYDVVRNVFVTARTPSMLTCGND